MSSVVAAGDILAGKFRVDQVLGIGGMGMVVAATHLELEQKVALKFMLPNALASEQAMDRFLREAKAAVRLRSEHICRVLDVGRLDNGAPYIVMELMEGQDFAQLLQRSGPLPVADAVDHVLQAIEGLAEAHAHGIVHRDLKPGNLFVCADTDGSPLVKVLDFGISKSALGAGGMATKTGDIMGSPAYMAPEQMVSAKNVDARADVWALGAILYQAVTNALPFDADSLPALCMMVMNDEPPPLLTLRPQLPPAFAAVVMRCLAKKADARWANVAELASALAPFGGEDAAASAKRSGKVLRQKQTAPAAAVSAADSSAAGIAPTLMTDSDLRLAATAAPPGRISTLQSSAAEVAVAVVAPATRSRLPLFGGLAALAVAGVIGVAVLAGGGGSPTPTPQPSAAQPTAIAPTPTPTAVTPPPAAAPVAETPPPPPVPDPTPVAATPVAATPVAATPVAARPRPSAAAHATPKKAPVPAAPAAPTPTPVAAPTPEPAAAPPAPPAPAPNPDDKWTHMQHDKGH